MARFVVQAEDLITSGFAATGIRGATEGLAASLWAPGGHSQRQGVLTYTFAGDAGVYDLQVAAYDENDGEGAFTVLVNGVEVDTVTLDQDLGSGAPNSATRQLYAFRGLDLSAGDVITIQARAHRSEFIRIDEPDLR